MAVHKPVSGGDQMARRYEPVTPIQVEGGGAPPVAHCDHILLESSGDDVLQEDGSSVICLESAA